jgi:hypothetical protein
VSTANGCGLGAPTFGTPVSGVGGNFGKLLDGLDNLNNASSGSVFDSMSDRVQKFWIASDEQSESYLELSAATMPSEAGSGTAGPGRDPTSCVA